MGNLGTIIKNPNCRDDIVQRIEGGIPRLSTPLFDLAAAAYANGVARQDVTTLRQIAETSIARFSAELKPFGSLGGKSRRKKRKTNKLKKNKKSRK